MWQSVHGSIVTHLPLTPEQPNMRIGNVLTLIVVLRTMNFFEYISFRLFGSKLVGTLSTLLPIRKERIPWLGLHKDGN